MRVPFRGLLTALLIGGILIACGGNSTGGNGSPNNPPNNPSGTNPCSSSSIEPEADTPLVGAVTGAASAKAEAVDGSSRWRVLDALWTHRQHAERELPTQQITTGRSAVDVGEIAVVQDEGDLVLSPNQFDLRGAGIRFTRNSSGGYDARRIDGAFRTALGRQLTLTDDDTLQVDVPFGFGFYGRQQTVAFVNSDGNVTFEEGDKASTERNVTRLLTGPPRVSPFLADLDPTAGGRIFVNAASDQYTVTWCTVRGFDSARTLTAQTTLLPDGTIEMKFAEGTTGLGDAVVGVSPGHTGDFRPVNLSDTGPTNGGSAAVGERFAEQGELDTVALIRKFYQSHPDSYDQLVIWTDAAIVQDAFAYETTVANEIRGIGIDIYDASRDFGSGGRLRSFALMDWVDKYPDDPQTKFLGENNTLSVLGQEVGHRWLAFLEFRDHNGRQSQALLGRGLAHWSFFFDSDASVMEGNDIEDLGGGSFRTVASVQRYSLLDQYAMGLVAPSQVPTFFYVENPTNVVPSRNNESAPRVGVTFNGTRREVLLQDVTSVLGARNPTVADSPKLHRQAFVYLVSAARTPNNSHIDKIDRIRREWETFFLQATDGRMRIESRLR
jgi:hypothetical protein